MKEQYLWDHSRIENLPSDSKVMWTRVQGEIQEKLTEEDFQSWFEGLELLEHKPELRQINIGVPSEYRRDMITKHYFDLLDDIITNCNGERLNINFEIMGNNNISIKRPPTVRIEKSEPKTSISQYLKLNDRYSFDNFVIGAGNRFTHAAALAVAESPAKAYNPLFIYGGVGLGKTHLMQAIGHQALKNKPDIIVAYLPAEQFMTEFIDSIQRNERIEFQSKFRNVDILLIDDIHFLAGKEQTQEEFFHTFNSLHNNHKQIVLSSDRPPKEIPTLEERLRSRFEWGLITDMAPPDLETRMAILRQKAKQSNIYLPDDVTLFIADKIRYNVRELESALIKIAAHAKFSNDGISVELASQLLSDILIRDTGDITVERIVKTVCEHYHIKPSDMLGKKRLRSIAIPRRVAMYLSRELTSHSLPEIGIYFGGKDHTTVLHACRKMKREIEEDEEKNKTISRLMTMIKH